MTIHHPGMLPSSVKARLPAADCAKSPKATCAPATCCSPPAWASHRLGIRAFSASSVSHVALYVGEGQVAEATGAGVQVITLQQALAHSDKLFALRVPDLTPDQATAMKSFAPAGQRQRV